MPTMIRYVFRDRPITIKNAATADPQRIGEALAEIRARTTGKCNSGTYVAAVAADTRNVLHQHLEWDNEIAGHRYRLEQMRELIACIDLVDGKGKQARQLPAFISLNEKGGRSYHGVREVMDSATLSALALRQAEAEMAAMEKRLMQFGEICNAIRRVREMIAERRRRYDAGAHTAHA